MITPLERFTEVRLSARTAASASLLCALIGAWSPVSVAIAAEDTKTFSIEQQPLASALNEFARQSDYQILFSTDVVASKNTAGIRGELDWESALRELLKGTGLSFRVTAERTILIDGPRTGDTAQVPLQPTPKRFASTQPPQLDASDSPPAAADAAARVEPEEIVVTGSRIARRDYSSSSPILTVDDEAIARNGGVTLERTFTQLPQFTPTFGAASAFPSRGGQTNINLRGLGTNRALVLVNGRRVQPANADGTLDVNVIPNQLIENIETITGGASSTYGSDAMAGVVNLKLKQRFSGVQVDAQAGVSDRGDGDSQSFSVLAGTDLWNGRGNALLALNYTNREPVERRDRSFFELSVPLGFLPSGTVNLASNPPSQAAVDQVFGTYGAAPGSISGTRALGINSDGTLYTAAPAPSPVVNYRGQLDDFILIYNNNLVENSGMTYHIQIPLERYNAFARAEYDLTDNVRIYAEGFYTSYEAQAQISNTALGLQGQIMMVPVSNPFLSQDLRTLLGSRTRPTADFPLNYLFTQYGPQSFNTDWDSFQVVTGLTGTIPSLGWTWEAYVSPGRTTAEERRTNNVSLSSISRLLRAPDGGASVCRGGLNLFGLQPISPECLAYIARTPSSDTILEQRVAEANLQGAFADLPAGEAKFAIGADYRENSYRFVPDADFAAGDIAGSPAALPSRGDQDVYEAYAELLLPLIADVPMVRQLDAALGYRYSEYDRLGAAHTYKADLDWSVFDGIRVRGGYSRAIRAPSLADLFAARNTVNVSVGSPIGTGGAATFNGDPCDVRGLYRRGPNGAAVRQICLAQGVPTGVIDSFTYASTNIVGTNEGNLALHEETADTYSIGLVLRSPFTAPLLSRLSASIDYYNIRIDDAVGQLSASTSLARCFNGDGISNPTYDPANVYCGYIRRDSLGNPTNTIVPTLNLASYETSGIDMQIDWGVDLDQIGFGGNAGRVDLSFAGTLLEEFSVVTIAGAAEQDFAGYTSGAISGGVLPEFKSIVTTSYTLGGGTLGLRWRHLSSVDDASRVTNPTSTVAGVPSYDYFDLFGRYQFDRRWELRAGVNNVGDKGPPAIGTAPGVTDANTYDVIGRSYFLALRAEF